MEKFTGHVGDIGLWQINELPKGVKPMDTKILWHGETGHLHRFTDESDVKIYEGLGELLGFRYFAVGPQGATITHEEHKEVDFQPGTIIKTRIERTLNPFTDEIQKVQD